MEQSPFSEANNNSAAQEIPLILYRGRKSPPLVHNLSQMNPVHTIPFHVCEIHSKIIFHLSFPIKILHKYLIIPMRATYLTYLILLDLITLIIFGETYKL
jgi:hypothetical protein